MIYELRIYTIHPGRLADILARFEKRAIELLKKHNILIVDFWQDLSEEKIYYVVQHEDVVSRNNNFNAFFLDPEWIETKRLSEINGPIVAKIESYLMSRVNFPEAKQFLP